MILTGMMLSRDEYSDTPIDYSLESDPLAQDNNNNCSEADDVTGGGEPFYSPSMDTITSTLRWGFYVHAYGFAFLFFFLAFYSFFSILNLR
jgi:hypothetical protein